MQCKLKGPDAELTEREVDDEVKKALEFVPRLREFIIVTTAPDDANLQRIARELTIKSADTGRQIAINVWGWETLEQRINEHGAATPATLFEVAKQDSTEGQKKFRAVAEFIGKETAEINSHIRVTILFLSHVWDDLSIPDLVKRACSGIMIEQLLRFRNADYPQIITAMRSRLIKYPHASEYLETWISGHFLSI